MTSSSVVRFSLGLLLGAVALDAHADVTVTACGAAVPAGATGVLAGDLDCSTFVGDGVTLLGSATTLNLNGFELIGNPAAAPANGVTCSAGCNVFGPGTIRDFSQDGIQSPGSVMLRDATVSGSGRYGVRGNQISITDSTVTASGSYAVWATLGARLLRTSVTNNPVVGVIADNRPTGGRVKGTVIAEDSVISDNGSGVFAPARALITGCTLERNSVAMTAYAITVRSSQVLDNDYSLDATGFDERPRISVTDSIVGDNGHGVEAFWRNTYYVPSGKVTVRNSEISNNGTSGVTSFNVTIEESQVSGNAGHGVVASRIRIDASTVSGNASDGAHAWNGDDDLGHTYVGTVSVMDTTVSGNLGDGLYSEGRLKASGSSITGNHTGPGCGPTASSHCADIESGREPSLDATTCETSYRIDDGTDWDVCSSDP